MVRSAPLTGEAKILDAWHGDYPVAMLDLLPEGQQAAPVGYIADADRFASVWAVFMPDVPAPAVDFKKQLVIFSRNTQFYNRLRIAKIIVSSGVAEVIAMETMSAMPIEDKVAISMVVIFRDGITAIRNHNETILVN